MPLLTKSVVLSLEAYKQLSHSLARLNTCQFGCCFQISKGLRCFTFSALYKGIPDYIHSHLPSYTHYPPRLL